MSKLTNGKVTQIATIRDASAESKENAVKATITPQKCQILRAKWTSFRAFKFMAYIDVSI